MKPSFYFAIVTFLLIVFSSFSVVFAVQNMWLEKSQMPTGRFSFGMAVVDKRIYVLGGAVDTESGELTGANEVYDTKNDVWAEKKVMLIPRYGCAVVAYESKILVFGGIANGTCFNLNESYDPSTDSWENRTSMPTARGLLQANVVDDKIYLIGGLGNQTANEVYEPETDSWTTKSSIPIGVISYVSAVVDNKIIVIGGTNANLTQIYDSQTDIWSFGASIPVNVYGAGSSTVTNEDGTKAIYVVGGETGVFSPQSIIQIYFPKNNTWRIGASLPNVNSRLSVAHVDNSLYVIGGTRAVIHHGLAENLQCNIFSLIPEFPSLTLLPLFMIAILALIFKKRRF